MKNFNFEDHLPSFLQDKRLRWISLVLIVLSIVAVIVAFFMNFNLALFLLVLFLVILGAVFYALETITNNTNRYISDLSYRIKRGEQEALIKMPIGILLYNEKNEVQWTNPYLQLYLGNREVLGKKIVDVDPELAKLVEENAGISQSKVVHWGESQFEIIIQESIRVVYLMDVTKYAEIQDRYLAEQVVIGQIFLDNYDEITQSLDDQMVSNLNSYVTNELSGWAKNFEMFIKRVSNDQFILVAHVDALHKIEEDKFKILDKIRNDTSQQNYPLTLSIGLAYGSQDLAALANQAQSNLDLALGRGGDQVVVKAKDEQAHFYGGKTNPMEKRTRVRARMISQALQEIMSQTDQVFVMGHNRPDMDAIGAALGIRRIAEMNHKTCYIVVNQETVHSDIARLLEAVKQYPDIEPFIVTPEEALAKATDQSLLVLVDHSKPSISISPELYERLANRTVVIDHHRRGEEFPENPMLVYIEPYASSTCELITEMFEYQPKDAPSVNKIEATAMLAGITVDTKSFSLRTGTRTFDAASYLRSIGADALMIQHLLKENVDNYIQKNHLIETVEFVAPNMALCTGEEDQTYDPVIAAQAADTLLSLSGIDASFVVVKRPDTVVSISARSLGAVNVQVIMEALGGGGHLSNAATQIKDTSVGAAKDQLIAAINQYLANEEQENS